MAGNNTKSVKIKHRNPYLFYFYGFKVAMRAGFEFTTP